jgi:hypothetical protein
MLLNKKTVKETWEAFTMMHLGADRIKEVNAQKLLAEFEAISFKPGRPSMISPTESPSSPQICVISGRTASMTHVW